MYNNKQVNIDWGIILIYLSLIFFGWLSIYSSSYTPEHSFNLLAIKTIYSKQFFFIICSLFIGVFIMLLDVKLISRLGYLIYIISIVSLILVLFIGKEVGGAKAWFNFGKFGLQPAEFAKFATILAIAKFINDQKIYLNKTMHIIQVGLFIACPFILILMQPDAGSALIYTSLIIVFFREGLKAQYLFFVFLVCILSISTIILGIKTTILLYVILNLFFAYILKKNRKHIMPALISFIIGTFLISGINYGYENILQPHQKERIDLIIGKEKNNLGSGYNLNQSLIAIGSGGVLGKGYLEGTQTKFNFVPEQNTDFIFCTIGEEFGFLGSIFIVILFFSLIIRVLFLSEKQTSRFSRIIGYSLASILFSHVFINIGMTLGLMPVIGIPLPFFSYGGSSLLSFSMLLFTFIKLDAYRIHRF
tara:strand:+ start:1132 stop:2388 length:1257 start_codon:yes stop_codon:yes gene_type:complete